MMPDHHQRYLLLIHVGHGFRSYLDLILPELMKYLYHWRIRQHCCQIHREAFYENENISIGTNRKVISRYGIAIHLLDIRWLNKSLSFGFEI